MFILHHIELYLSKKDDCEITVSNNDWKKWLEKKGKLEEWLALASISRSTHLFSPKKFEKSIFLVMESVSARNYFSSKFSWTFGLI